VEFVHPFQASAVAVEAAGQLQADQGTPDLPSAIVSIYPVLLSYARRLAGNGADAEDLVHDAIARGLLRRHLFRTGTPERWLATILRHLFFDACRRRRCWKAIHAEWRRVSLERESDTHRAPRGHGEAADPMASSDYSLEDVRRAARDLNPPLRVVFQMFVFERISQREIARRLSLPPSTVGTRLLRARRQLRTLLTVGAAPTPMRRPPRPRKLPLEKARAA
jgi:RNA polymerase sigma-70 factor (ECF subfamily)